MTSRATEFAVFVHLDQQLEGVPAGLLTLLERGAELLQSRFRYGKRYAARPQCIELDPLTLVLPGPGIDMTREPPLTPAGHLVEFGVFRDAAPDRWGRRVIENKLRRAGPLAESEYLAHAGSNRAGALDFRAKPDSPEAPRQLAQLIDLAYLKEAAERIEMGEQVPARLEQIFDAGPSMGGARAKAVIEARGRQWLAKFSQASDAFCVPRVERATLLLARTAGLDVPRVEIEEVGNGRPVMLIERFDRPPKYAPSGNHEGYARRHFISALSMLAKHESESPNASYAEISEALATHGAAASARSDQAELFGRLVFNILVNNNDDHLRNHGFVFDVDAGGWRLSPLYDVVPAPSLATERYLHLSIGTQGRLATLPNAISQYGVFGLTRSRAIEIIDRICRTVRQWRGYFEEAGVSGQDIDRIASAFRHPRDLGFDTLRVAP